MAAATDDVSYSSMRRGRHTCSDRRALGRMEEQRERNGGSRRGDERHHEQILEISHAVHRINFLDQPRTNRIRQERTDAQNLQVEQTLRARSNVLREVSIDEDI